LDTPTAHCRHASGSGALPTHTPTIFIDISGEKAGNVPLYGHLDTQLEMPGWRDGLGPWQPVMADGKLCGRGGADASGLSDHGLCLISMTYSRPNQRPSWSRQEKSSDPCLTGSAAMSTRCRPRPAGRLDVSRTASRPAHLPFPRRNVLHRPLEQICAGQIPGHLIETRGKRRVGRHIGRTAVVGHRPAVTLRNLLRRKQFAIHAQAAESCRR
jgi:hypothetical protein